MRTPRGTRSWSPSGRRKRKSNPSRPGSPAPSLSPTSFASGTRMKRRSPRKCAAIKNAINLLGRRAVLRVRAALDGEETLLRVLAGLDRFQLQAPQPLRGGCLFGGHAAVFGDVHRPPRRSRGDLRRVAKQLGRPADVPRHPADAAAHRSHWRDRRRESPCTCGIFWSRPPAITITPSSSKKGLSYEPFTRAMGERPIILHPDGDLTINYFDTGGLPLGQLQLATAVASSRG